MVVWFEKKIEKVSFSLGLSLGDLLLSYSIPWCKPSVDMFHLLLLDYKVHK